MAFLRLRARLPPEPYEICDNFVLNPIPTIAVLNLFSVAVPMPSAAPKLASSGVGSEALPPSVLSYSR